MNVIILAAGFGTRLYPLTLGVPKALLDVGGKTMLDHLMENISRIRPDSVLLVTNNRFYEHFLYWKSEQKFPFEIQLLNNGANTNEERKGAVVDLYNAVFDRRMGAGDYLVLASDNYFDYPLSHFLLQAIHHLPKPVIGCFDIQNSDEATKFGVLEINQDTEVVSFEEKPVHPKSTLVSTGIYLLPKTISFLMYEYLKIQKGATDRLGDFIQWLCKRKRVLTVHIEGKWLDVGDMASYQRIKEVVSGDQFTHLRK